MSLQGDVLVSVHDGVEVQVAASVGDQVRGDHRPARVVAERWADVSGGADRHASESGFVDDLGDAGAV